MSEREIIIEKKLEHMVERVSYYNELKNLHKKKLF